MVADGELSEYSVSSDAETEKMGDEKTKELDGSRPHISELVKEGKRSLEDTDVLEDNKRVKLETEPHEDDDNEAGDEGEDEEEEDAEIPTVEPMKQEVEEEEDEEEEVEEDEDEIAEDEEEVDKTLEHKDDEIIEPMSSMPSPFEVESRRMDALKEITQIEYKFAQLRQQLYENKLLRLQAELQMCLEGSHPELQTYYQKIASVRDYKLRRAYQRQKYELNCIDTETRATRTFIHQDFYRKVSDTRNNLLKETTQRWYDINKERRDMDICIPEVSYHVPIKIAGKTLSCITGYAGPAQQRYPGEPLSEDLECENITFHYRSNAVDKLEVIVDRMRLNNELSDLEGLKKYFNAFPSAPNLNGLRDSEIYDDLQDLTL